MEVTKQELKTVWKELLSEDPDFRREVRAELSPVGGMNPEAKAFRGGIKDELNDMYHAKYGENTSGGYHLIEAFNILMRYQLGIKNVGALRDNQVDQARRLFEGYKQLLAVEP